MQAIKARIIKGLQHGSMIETCDNSGAKIVKIISVIMAGPVRHEFNP